LSPRTSLQAGEVSAVSKKCSCPVEKLSHTTGRFQKMFLSCGEVVPHDDFVAVTQELIGEAAADEAGPAGDERSHSP